MSADIYRASVSAVVVVWNSRRFLAELFKSLQAQSLGLSDIVAVDNGSEDGSSTWIKAAFPTVTVIENQRNLGYSVACNQGIYQARGEWVLVLNSDVKLSGNFLEEAVKATGNDEHIGAVSGKVLRFDRKTIDTCGQVLGRNRRIYELGYSEVNRDQYDKSAEVFSVCGAVALYRREMLEDIAVDGEIFDEDFFAFYEDMDLGWRARNRGWKSVYTPDAVAYHHRGGTNPPAADRWRFWTRWEFSRRPRAIQKHILINRYLMMIKNDRLRDFIRYSPFIIAYDLAVWGFVVLSRPILILDFLKDIGKLKRAFRKRCMIREKSRGLPIQRDKRVRC